MKRLWVRLSLAFLAVASLAVMMVAALVLHTTETTFRQYVRQRDVAQSEASITKRLTNYYAQNGTWEGVEEVLPGPKGGAQHGRQHNGAADTESEPGRVGERGLETIVADRDGIVQAATNPAYVGEKLDARQLEQAAPLSVEGEQVGWLWMKTPSEDTLGQAENEFLAQINRRLTYTALGVAVLAVVVGVGLAWQITRPLRALTHAVEALQHGHLGRQVPIRGALEINELAQAFNAFSQALAESERLRQRMAADIAHELRTPVSVLRGHLEAMLDGVYPLDAEHLAVAYDRTLHLARLVDDLRLLTSAEAGQLTLRRVHTTPEAIVTWAVESFTPLARDAEIALRAELSPDLPPLEVDIDRIHQVLGNLLINALRHTPTNGRITVGAQRQGAKVALYVSNTGSTLTPEEQAHVFKPFWRAEDARERDSGGVGLGLAIARQLVRAHGGDMSVASTQGQTTFTVTLPAASPDATT